MTRNLGGSIGIALLATALSNREHFHSARLGESISGYADTTQQRIDQLTAQFSASFDPATAGDKAIGLIDSIVRREAYVMAYNDGFFLVGVILISCIALLWFADRVISPSGAGGGGH
jgi:DHA2 family multidrug resistance protein